MRDAWIPFIAGGLLVGLAFMCYWGRSPAVVREEAPEVIDADLEARIAEVTAELHAIQCRLDVALCNVATRTDGQALRRQLDAELRFDDSGYVRRREPW